MSPTSVRICTEVVAAPRRICLAIWRAPAATADEAFSRCRACGLGLKGAGSGVRRWAVVDARSEVLGRNAQPLTNLISENEFALNLALSSQRPENML